jgi:hypothetical protein
MAPNDNILLNFQKLHLQRQQILKSYIYEYRWADWPVYSSISLVIKSNIVIFLSFFHRGFLGPLFRVVINIGGLRLQWRISVEIIIDTKIGILWNILNDLLVITKLINNI